MVRIARPNPFDGSLVQVAGPVHNHGEWCHAPEPVIMMRISFRYPAAQALTLIIVASFVCPPAYTEAQAKGVHPQPAPVAQAVRLTSGVSVDGKLDEEVWRTAPAITEFRQSQPDEGKPATQKTEVRFAYDDQAIYVGARMFDTMGG